MITRICMLAALLLVTIVPQPAGAFFTETQRYGYVLERTDEGATSFSLRAYVSRHQSPGGGRDRSVLGVVGILDDDAEVRAIPVGMLAPREDQAPFVYHDGERYGCEEAGCGVLGQWGAGGTLMDYDDADATDRLRRVLIVAESSEAPIIELEAQGWELREVPLTFRYSVREGNDQATGLDNGAYSLEVFRSASLEGGAGGSIAMAEPPCSSATVAVTQGVGSATLRGGTDEPTVICPAVAGGPVAAFAPAETTWTFQADPVVVGLTVLSEVRLLVIDLPTDEDLTS